MNATDHDGDPQHGHRPRKEISEMTRAKGKAIAKAQTTGTTPTTPYAITPNELGRLWGAAYTKRFTALAVCVADNKDELIAALKKVGLGDPSVTPPGQAMVDAFLPIWFDDVLQTADEVRRP